jgi:hypothetical protein
MPTRYSQVAADALITMPSSMLSGTYDGTFYLEYPAATDHTLAGKPCAAFGLPRALIKSNMMTASGMNNWQALFIGTALYAPLWLDVWNPQTGTTMVASGILQRPSWQRVVGYGNSARFYEGVEITIINIDYLV